MVSNSNFVFVLVGEPNLLVEVELKEATNGMTLVVQDETIKMQANQSIMCHKSRRNPVRCAQHEADAPPPLHSASPSLLSSRSKF